MLTLCLTSLVAAVYLGWRTRRSEKQLSLVLGIHREAMGIVRRQSDDLELYQAIVLANPSTANALFAVVDAENGLRDTPVENFSPTLAAD